MTDATARPQTAIGMVRAKSAKKRARSAGTTRPRAKTAGLERTRMVWPPPVSWPANRGTVYVPDDEGRGYTFN